MGRRRGTVTGSTVPGVAAAPSSVPVASIAHNPRNPRENYDDVDELTESIRTTGVLQALGVVRYEIFLTHYPEHEHDIGAHDWVVINGNRRLAAARQAGLAEIPVRALDHLGRDGMLDEAVLVENIHRAALSPIREAAALQLLVERHGSQAQVATRIGKTKGFVSQRLALLGLTGSLQQDLHDGGLSLEEARDLGRLPADEQLAERDRRRSAADAADSAAPAGTGGVYDGNASNDSSPRPRRSTARTPAIKVGDPGDIAAQLRRHLSTEQINELGHLLLEGPARA